MRRIYIAVLSVAVLSAVRAAALESAPPRSPHKADFEKAYELKERKADVQALAAFNAILKKDPSNHAALTEAGYLHASLKQYASAVKNLSAASAQDPENMRLRMDLGYAQQALKRYADAEKQFQAVAARPGEFQAAAQAASLEVRRLASAEADPAEAKRRELMERGYAALRKGDRAAARKAFASVAAARPGDEAARKQLGFLNFEEGKLSAAAADFEAVRALYPHDYLVALQLGYTYERLKQTGKARAAFAAALVSTDPKIHGAAQAALQASGGPEAPAPATSL